MSRIAVIGAGPGGLCAAIKLKQAGYTDLVVYEQADGVGGTWRHNQYPGAACDVQTFLYSFSFNPKLDWQQAYSGQPEILAYFESCVAKYSLEPHLRLDTRVDSLTWQPSTSTWSIRTRDGRTDIADFVIGSVGMFNEINKPLISGLEEFEGQTLHTARWPRNASLDGSSVAVIGTGSSSVQVVPTIASLVSRLYVFQRSAHWVIPRENEAYSAEQLAEFRRQPEILQRRRETLRATIDTWITFTDAEVRRKATEAGLANVSVIASDRVRQAMTPTTPYGCHRPALSSDFYPAFNRDNVELVTESIDHIESDAIVTQSGRRVPVTTIVLATGFATQKFLSTIDVIGRSGRSLSAQWEQRAQAYKGITVPGFPNLFMTFGPNTNNGSVIFMIECQVEYIVRHLAVLRATGMKTIEVREEAHARYNVTLQRDLDKVTVWNAGCSTYYRAKDGHIATQWPHTMAAYQKLTAVDDDADYVMTRTPDATTRIQDAAD